MRKHLTRPRHSKFEKTFAILVIAIVEIAAGIYFWDHTKPLILGGHLVKNGDVYMVFWKNSWNEEMAATHSSLHEALKFAGNDLGLVQKTNPETSPTIEHLWIRSDIGRSILYWKTFSTGNLNRLTFKKESEALLFERIFRQGAYTPSPYGHSISLLPAKKG